MTNTNMKTQVRLKPRIQWGQIYLSGLNDQRHHGGKHTQDEEEKEDLVLTIREVDHGHVGEFVALLKSARHRKQILIEKQRWIQESEHQ